MSNLKVLVFGSNGLVGNSVSRILNDSSKVGELYLSQRSDTDLEEKIQIEKKINEVNPDIIINCAAKVGGIYANNTYRTDFLIKNLNITPALAARGTANSKPIKPKKAPNKESARINDTGCKPTELPTNFGVKILPSNI